MRVKKITSIIMAFAMIISLGVAASDGQTVKAAENTLNGPRTDSNGDVTYDCIWFGSYPQAEVITTEKSENYTEIVSRCLRDGDLIVDDDIYNTLKNATGWDAKGDITLPNGDKYRRVDSDSDTTYYRTGTTQYYNWSDDDYHYFKYEPIKWRILSVDGNEALLLSEDGLDDQCYNISFYDAGYVGGNTDIDCTWETCTLRSWLNGYNSTYNLRKQDYTTKNFVNSAFDAQEKNAIKSKTLVNENNMAHEIPGGKSTTDKVFVLSFSDVLNPKYGFSSDHLESDMARLTRTTTYARAMGANWTDMTTQKYMGTSAWWLRTPGSAANYAAYVFCGARVSRDGYLCSYAINSVRPSLYLNLSATNLYMYAGTVNSNGNVNEVAPGLRTQTIT
ncbi:MAG: DUF6273 domain-containing protein, partial [Coprococcus sp.]